MRPSLVGVCSLEFAEIVTADWSSRNAGFTTMGLVFPSGCIEENLYELGMYVAGACIT